MFEDIMMDECMVGITSGSAIMSFGRLNYAPYYPTQPKYEPVNRVVKKHRCSYCRSNWREDSRGNCKSCGAPE